MSRYTLKNIADELGVSVSTVSRAVNGKSVVKEETRQLILDAVNKYSYIPNEVARSLKKSFTKTIAVVLPDISETLFGTIVKEIDNVVSQKGYMVIISDTNEDIEKEQRTLEMIYKRRIDALVLATVDCSGASAGMFVENDIPIVFIDNVPKLKNINLITIDNKAAGKMGTEYLISRGHRKTAAIIGSVKETTGADRLAGYKEALKKNNISFNENLIRYGDYKTESGYRAMCDLLKERNTTKFSAVFVTSEQMTYGALRAIHDKGLNVPEDISVMGFDIHNLKDDRRQMITSVRQPETVIGRSVGERLLDCLDESRNRKSEEKMLLMPYLEYGDTVLDKNE